MPAQATRIPSGKALFGVSAFLFAANISRDAYDVVVASSTRPCFSSHSSHSLMTLAVDGLNVGLVSYTGCAPGFNLNICGSTPFIAGGNTLV